MSYAYTRDTMIPVVRNWKAEHQLRTSVVLDEEPYEVLDAQYVTFFAHDPKAADIRQLSDEVIQYLGYMESPKEKLPWHRMTEISHVRAVATGIRGAFAINATRKDAIQIHNKGVIEKNPRPMHLNADYIITDIQQPIDMVDMIGNLNIHRQALPHVESLLNREARAIRDRLATRLRLHSSGTVPLTDVLEKFRDLVEYKRWLLIHNRDLASMAASEYRRPVQWPDPKTLKQTERYYIARNFIARDAVDRFEFSTSNVNFGDDHVMAFVPHRTRVEIPGNLIIDASNVIGTGQVTSPQVKRVSVNTATKKEEIQIKQKSVPVNIPVDTTINRTVSSHQMTRIDTSFKFTVRNVTSLFSKMPTYDTKTKILYLPRGFASTARCYFDDKVKVPLMTEMESLVENDETPNSVKIAGQRYYIQHRFDPVPASEELALSSVFPYCLLYA